MVPPGERNWQMIYPDLASKIGGLKMPPIKWENKSYKLVNTPKYVYGTFIFSAESSKEPR
jgi:hypothetical protein